jgi:hypothetical protein
MPCSLAHASRAVALVAALASPVVGCGGSVATNNADSGVPTDSSGDGCVGCRVPKNHRPVALTCAPSPSPGACSGPAGGPGAACRLDADCKSGKNGHCALTGGGILMCGCFYDTCTNDSECSTGGPCACQGSPYQPIINGCAPAGNCRVDADCGPSGYCSPSSGAGCSNSISGYYCHTSSDECVDDADCTSSSGPRSCQYDGTKRRWACTEVLACL